MTLISHIFAACAYGIPGPLGLTDRVIVTVPPRHGKSELISRWCPVWFLDHFPHKRVLMGSYSAGYAAEWGAKALLSAETHQGQLRMKLGSKSAADNWLTTEGGGMVTSGVGGGFTGRGADALILDDLVKNADEAMSATYRQKQWEFLQSTALSRLEPGGFAFLLMTRWHKDDVAGRLISNFEDHGEKWTLINFPAIAEEDEPIIGRLAGEALWPQRYDEEALARIKQRNAYWWTSLYQQRPTDLTGGLWKRSWFKRYCTCTTMCPNGYPKLPKRWDWTWQSWDTAGTDPENAGKVKEGSGFSVGGHLGAYDGDAYLLDVYRKQVLYPELKPAAKNFASKHRPHAVAIEKMDTGKSLLQELEIDRDFAPALIAVQPEGSKLIRAMAESAFVAEGRFYLPETAPWLLDYEDEITSFPGSVWKDQMDMTTQALKVLREQGFESTLRAMARQ